MYRAWKELCALTQVAMIVASCTPTTPVLILSWIGGGDGGRCMMLLHPTLTCTDDDDKLAVLPHVHYCVLLLPSPTCQRAV